MASRSRRLFADRQGTESNLGFGSRPFSAALFAMLLGVLFSLNGRYPRPAPDWQLSAVTLDDRPVTYWLQPYEPPTAPHHAVDTRALKAIAASLDYEEGIEFFHDHTQCLIVWYRTQAHFHLDRELQRQLDNSLAVLSAEAASTSQYEGYLSRHNRQPPNRLNQILRFTNRNHQTSKT